MKIHEFQAKQLLRAAGVSVPASRVVDTPVDARAAFEELAGKLAVVKAQIHAGGRGKGTIKTNPQQRGVQLVRSAEDAAQATGNMLGQPLVTKQTGPEGQTVRKVLVEAGCSIARELYLGIVVDRSVARPVMMVSSEGGMDIEEVAAQNPEKIFKAGFEPHIGLESFQVRKLAKLLKLEKASLKSADRMLKRLSRLFVDHDCSLLEINPLVVTEDGELIALDAKINFDDNARFRHPNWEELRDLSEEEPAEVRAANAGLSYIKLDGSVGCLVNGAGLAMSTMDLIKLHGGEPANFLDVGGGADSKAVTEAFRIILEDEHVKAVLVNIFGGIMRCTTIAEAIVEAYNSVGFNVPLVVRLEGTEVAEGREILAKSGTDLINADGLTDAAKKVVAAANR